MENFKARHRYLERQKRVTPDGSDGMEINWNDKRCRKRIQERRHSRGERLMSRGAF